MITRLGLGDSVVEDVWCRHGSLFIQNYKPGRVRREDAPLLVFHPECRVFATHPTGLDSGLPTLGVAFSVMDCDHHDPCRFQPIVHGMRESLYAGMSYIFVDRGMQFRVLLDSIQYGLDLRQEFFAKSDTLILKPLIGFVDFFPDIPPEDEREFHRGRLT